MTKIKEKINSKLLEEQNESLAKEGYRVIALAVNKVAKKQNYTDKDIKDLVFIGLVGFIWHVRSPYR